MAGRIGEDPPPVLIGLMNRLAGPQLQQTGFGLVQVHDVEAEVHLLGDGWSGQLGAR